MVMDGNKNAKEKPTKFEILKPKITTNPKATQCNIYTKKQVVPVFAGDQCYPNILILQNGYGYMGTLYPAGIFCVYFHYTDNVDPQLMDNHTKNMEKQIHYHIFGILRIQTNQKKKNQREINQVVRVNQRKMIHVKVL